MKEKFKSFFVNILLVSTISYGIVYGVNITNIGQTAVTGDVITASWVNDVNTRLYNQGNYIIDLNTRLNSLSTGGPGTVVAGCGYRGNRICWGGASATAYTPICPNGSTARSLSYNRSGGGDNSSAADSFICVKN